MNSQPTEKRERYGLLEVHSVWPTIQGEGPYAGRPAVFVRLAGCNLQCPMCDTDYTSKRSLMTPGQLVSIIGSNVLSSSPGLVVITGGEPFRQDLIELEGILARAYYDVQIETNGTYNVVPHFNTKVVCSPKTQSIGMNPCYIHAFKYVVEHGKVDPNDGLPTSILGKECRVFRPANLISRMNRKHEIYIQPMDAGDPVRNNLNLEQAVSICQKFDYRLCVQIHKIIGAK